MIQGRRTETTADGLGQKDLIVLLRDGNHHKSKNMKEGPDQKQPSAPVTVEDFAIEGRGNGEGKDLDRQDPRDLSGGVRPKELFFVISSSTIHPERSSTLSVLHRGILTLHSTVHWAWSALHLRIDGDSNPPLSFQEHRRSSAHVLLSSPENFQWTPERTRYLMPGLWS
ncbi:hypothetical protein MMC29_002582 [Sticta canariensis]|nr:hypothetical protein [Sticta canariensis]